MPPFSNSNFSLFAPSYDRNNTANSSSNRARSISKNQPSARYSPYTIGRNAKSRREQTTSFFPSLNSSKQNSLFLRNSYVSPGIKKLVINPISTMTSEDIRGQRTNKHGTALLENIPVQESSNQLTNISSRDSIAPSNKSIILGTPSRNPAISRVYEVNKTALDEGYWIEPSLEVLFTYTFKQLHHVENLVVGRKGYGNIRYINPVNISTIKNISDILGNLVIFGKSTVCVYPEDNSSHRKPPPGVELNCPAIVTLENIFISSLVGNSIQRITDPSDSRVKVKTAQLKQSIVSKGAEFITYDASSGVFVFKVEHFSTWGFDDDDLIYDEDGYDNAAAFKLSSQTFQAEKDTYNEAQFNSSAFNSSINDTFIHKKPEIDSHFATSSEVQNPFNNTSNINHIKNLKISPDNSDPMSQTPFSFLNQPQHQLSLSNKASITSESSHNEDFDFNSDTEMKITGDDEETDNEISTPDHADLEDILIQDDDRPISKDWITELRFSSSFDSPLVPLKTLGVQKADNDNITHADLDSVIFGGPISLKDTITGQYIEAARKLGLPSFESKASFAKFSSNMLLTKGSTPSSFRILNPEGSPSIPSYFIKVINILKTFSKISPRKNEFPSITPISNLTFGSIVNELPTDTNSVDQEVFSLASILFDPLEFLGYKDPQELIAHDAINKVRHQFRSKLLATWISKTVSKDVAERVSKVSNDPLSQTFSYLTGNNIVDATLSATKGNNLHLAALISLLHSPTDSIRQSAKKQLRDWSENSCLKHIPKPVRIIYELLAGNTTVSSLNNDTVYISEGLSWLQAFGLRLWYECTVLNPISESVMKYEQAFSSTSNKVPPPYAKGNESVYDVRYQLLALYSSPKPSLENILHPLSSSTSSFDHRIPWLLHYVLVHGLSMEFSDSHKLGDRLCIDFARQLESNGYFSEACFVLGHLTMDDACQIEISNLIHRNIIKLDDNGIDLLKSTGVPDNIISFSKALYFRYTEDFWSECEELLNAKMWNEAHNRILATVAPQAVISNSLDRLLRLILKFVNFQVTISSWSKGLQVYLDYIRIVQETHAESSKLSRDAYGDMPLQQIFQRLSSGLQQFDVYHLESRVAANIMRSVLY